MNTLEILWVILNALGVFYSVKLLKEDDYFSVFLMVITFWSTLAMLCYFFFEYIDLLTTPLW